MSTRLTAAAIVGAALTAGAAPLEERVDVRLALLDVRVLDSEGRSVAGLARGDFELLVGYEPVEIETFDTLCADAAGSSAPPAGRYALVFDVFHLGVAARTESVAHARRIVESIGSDEIAIGVIPGRDPWIVQTFTRDRDALLRALDVVEAEAGTRWPSGTGHISDLHLLEGLARFADVAGAWPGSKSAVLFSTWIARSDREDHAFLDAARRAADARLAWYPVYAAGLEPDGELREPPGGSRSLARLANESGGRLTRLTNDLSTAFERAREDDRCRYTLGLYLRPGRGVEELRGKPVSVRVAGAGRTARHAERLDVSGDAARAVRALDAAIAAPEPFVDPGLALEAEPRGGRVRLRAEVEGAAPEDVTIAILDSRGGEVRRERAERTDEGYAVEFRLSGGRYRGVAAYVPPGEIRPRAAVVNFEVPPRAGGRNIRESNSEGA